MSATATANSGSIRDALLEVALNEFAEHGYAGARIERIVSAARCNIRMVYHYFRNKEGLYLAVIDSVFQELEAKTAQVVPDPEEPLQSLLDTMLFIFDYFDQHPVVEGLIRAENMAGGRFVAQSTYVHHAAAPITDKMRAIIASGTEKGIFRENIDAVQLYVTMTAIARFHLTNAYSLSALLNVAMTDESWRQDRRRHIVEVIEAYVRKPAG